MLTEWLTSRRETSVRFSCVHAQLRCTWLGEGEGWGLG